MQHFFAIAPQCVYNKCILPADVNGVDSSLHPLQLLIDVGCLLSYIAPVAQRENKGQNTGGYEEVGGLARTDYMTPEGYEIKQVVYKARLYSL